MQITSLIKGKHILLKVMDEPGQKGIIAEYENTTTSILL
jgi:hypothetical protein